MLDPELLTAIRYNCDISDGRDNAIYSICTLVLKLRNLYKWEHNLEPWEEPDSPILLDWIEEKENHWESLADLDYRSVPLDGGEYEPWDLSGINKALRSSNLIYGAGYGLSMKAVFFLAELLETRTVAGLPVLILGNERAKELSSPFAMLQDGVIYVRREPLRFFFWDQIQEIRSSCKLSFYHALEQYGLIRDKQLLRDSLSERLDDIVDHELPIFIHHEVGEHLQDTFTSHTLKKVISAFPDTIYEFVCRAIKDVLADIHPKGMLQFIIEEQRESSLGFYVGLQSGMRKVLFPEIGPAFSQFVQNKDWRLIEKGLDHCATNNLRRAAQIEEILSELNHLEPQQIKEQFHTKILQPLGIEAPQS